MVGRGLLQEIPSAWHVLEETRATTASDGVPLGRCLVDVGTVKASNSESIGAFLPSTPRVCCTTLVPKGVAWKFELPCS